MSEGIQKLLDRDALVVMYRNELGTYTAACVLDQCLVATFRKAYQDADPTCQFETDDKLPSRAMERLSEKVMRTGDYSDWPKEKGG